MDSRKRRFTAIDLFSGCGGLTQGLRDAGFDVVAAIEIDPLAVETYRSNHPTTHVENEDIQKVDADELRNLVLGRRRLDLLAACPPCQGFSAVRTRRRSSSTKDKRNRLVKEVLRFVDALRPRAVLFENVPALERDWRFADLCRGLRVRGYTVKHSIENAADYGVPQRRKRLILCAIEGDALILPAQKSALRNSVRHAIGHLPPVGISGDPLHDIKERRAARISAMIAAVPVDGGGRLDLGPQHQLDCHRRSNGFRDVYGRMRWNDVAPTITAGCINPSKGRFLHPYENRAITPREAALLQSFPVGYRFSLTNGKHRVAEMIGNALPPRFVKAHAMVLRHAIEDMQRVTN